MKDCLSKYPKTDLHNILSVFICVYPWFTFSFRNLNP